MKLRRMDTSQLSETNHKAESSSDLRRILCSGIRMLLIILSLWLVFYVCSTVLPGIRPAGEMVYAAKIEDLCRYVRFTDGVKNKVLIFGDSRILSGFVPELFDSIAGNTRSYNFGLPGTVHFLSILEAIIERGEIPTHVLLTIEWSDGDVENSRDSPRFSGNNLMDLLFPFRKLPRDLTLFLMRSQSRGGIVNYYRLGIKSVRSMLNARGYYFIEGQSIYPNHRLPEGFKLRKDDPERLLVRDFNTKNWIFDRLKELHCEYGISFYIVPCYYRKGYCAEPPSENNNTGLFTEYSGFKVLGPEYFVFPLKYFSDPAHLNREGAQVYTERLGRLLADNL